MRCSKSEELFEGRLDGTLTPLQHRELTAHLDRCARCSAVLEELRVIDALLLTPRALEPSPNFTFKTLAEIRTLPAPQPKRTTWPWMFAVYLFFSWLAIGVWFASGRPDGHAALALGTAAAAHFGGALEGIARAIGSSGVAGIVTLVLLLDLVLVAAVLYAGIVLHPRIVERLARSQSA